MSRHGPPGSARHRLRRAGRRLSWPWLIFATLIALWLIGRFGEPAPPAPSPTITAPCTAHAAPMTAGWVYP